MTYRDRFEAAMVRRSYEVERLGLITVLRHDNYTAFHFFKADGSLNRDERPFWTITRQGDPQKKSFEK